MIISPGGGNHLPRISLIDRSTKEKVLRASRGSKRKEKKEKKWPTSFTRTRAISLAVINVRWRDENDF